MGTLVRAPGRHWPGRLSSDDCFEGANLIEIVGASLAFFCRPKNGARRSLTRAFRSRRLDKIHC